VPEAGERSGTRKSSVDTTWGSESQALHRGKMKRRIGLLRLTTKNCVRRILGLPGTTPWLYERR